MAAYLAMGQPKYIILRHDVVGRFLLLDEWEWTKEASAGHVIKNMEAKRQFSIELRR